MFDLMSNKLKWALHLGFSSTVDFCVWVLERDGLQVHPFDRHPDGNRELREIGMTVELWQSWLKKIVLLMDSRLSWHIEDPEAKKQNMVADFERADLKIRAENPTLNYAPSDRLALDASIDKYFLWQEQQYQQAVKAFKDTYGTLEILNIRSASFAKVWDGDTTIGEKLQALWWHYHQVAYSQREKNSRDLIMVKSKNPSRRLSEVLAPYHERIPALEIYFVDYPCTVEYVISPVSVVISIADEFTDYSALETRVLDAAKRLELLNNKPTNP